VEQRDETIGEGNIRKLFGRNLKKEQTRTDLSGESGDRKEKDSLANEGARYSSRRKKRRVAA